MFYARANATYNTGTEKSPCSDGAMAPTISSGLSSAPPKDVANPSEFNAAMFTKVEQNMVGAAKAASVSDDEAVALWDRLLSGLKFRVKVPGAPEGSYFFPRGGTNAPSAQ
jgi:hypothetical protein